MDVFAELNDKGDRCHVHFRYSEGAVHAIKRVPGAKFVPRDKGGPLWQLPLDLVSMRRLREEFKDGLSLGDALRAWGRGAVAKEQKLRSLSVADDVPLRQLLLNKKLPKLAKALRPYQRADVKFMGTTNCLNLLEPRLGKTLETIGAVFEAEVEEGPFLVVAPKSSLDSVWRKEVEKWTDHVVITYSGDLTRSEKVEAERMFYYCLDNGMPVWFVTTADMVRRGGFWDVVKEWSAFIIDEFHKTGLAEVKNIFPQRAGKIAAKRKWALSGTPMGGKPIKLWGALHWLEPQQYTSKWRWAEQWLEVTTTIVGQNKYKEIGGIKEGREDDFYAALSVHAIRRLRSEVFPELPEKLWIDVDCTMTPKQTVQYETFARDAEIRIDEYHLSATSVLAEYTRLKQFSNSLCEVEVLRVDDETGLVDMKLRATPESGKVPQLLEKLAEVGIDPSDPDGDAQCIIASQFRETADMIHTYLNENGIACAKITGKVHGKERLRLQEDFQEGRLRVMVMTTTAGGVAITLSRAESVHILDETWNPDDQEQLADRALDLSKIHQVNVFVYRSKNTIEHKIMLVNTSKLDINTNVLDLRRQGLRATIKGKV